MKILILGSQARYEKYMPELDFIPQQQLVYMDKETPVKELLSAAGDADVLFIDPVTDCPRELVDGMPKLKLIQSEGVAFDRIPLDAASERGIPVCNNKGCNAEAVAEQAILLMLCLLRSAIVGDRAVREGRQMEMKEQCMFRGITELSACHVGLVGFGDIAQATARRLAPFGCKISYYAPHRRSPELERELGVSYLPLEELAASCDIVSLHCAVTPSTRGMVDEAFLRRMKPTAYLVNTARGDLVDNQALRQALVEERLAGAGLDTVSPEPVPKGHPLATMPAPACDKIVFAPHLGGITEAAFRRAHRHMWLNAQQILNGGQPTDIVNKAHS